MSLSNTMFMGFYNTQMSLSNTLFMGLYNTQMCTQGVYSM